MKPGITVLLEDQRLIRHLKGKRIALLSNEAATDLRGRTTLSLLRQMAGLQVTCAFGPQHGFFVEKQDNMIESDHMIHPDLKIPVFSLYGEERRLTREMLEMFDLLLIDLQDLGVRVYTYITTLIYLLEDCSGSGKEVWILDRPNPCGRKTEGLMLDPGWKSFIGAAKILLQYGLTIGELALWFREQHTINTELKVIRMEEYDPLAAPGYGWPVHEVPWVNPSPNAGSLNMARCYPGTCLIEGTTLSEGRGTTHPLEMAGAPDLDIPEVLGKMREIQETWMQGAVIRPCHFEPVVDKHAGKLCHGIQIHTDTAQYAPLLFKPFRLFALFLKAVRLEYPDYELWHSNEFEYERERMAIDLLAGSDFLRKWVDDTDAGPENLEKMLNQDEAVWKEGIESFLVY